jgi:Uri superfamily endonuclease
MKIDVKLISEFSTSGIYVLLLFATKEVTVTVGKLGTHRFPMGYSTYIGSALGKRAVNLKHRILRHLRKEKSQFWHIDYLLADENVSVEAVIAAETCKKIECNINNYIKSIEDAKVPIMGFGASDCKKNCESHLLYFPEVENADYLVQKVVRHLRFVCGILSVYVIQ